MREKRIGFCILIKRVGESIPEVTGPVTLIDSLINVFPHVSKIFILFVIHKALPNGNVM